MLKVQKLLLKSVNLQNLKSSDVKPDLSPEDVLKRQKKLKQMSDAREKKRLKREELKKVSFQDQELQEKKSEYVPKKSELVSEHVSDDRF